METFKKRQKEMLRLEKQREKAARRAAKVKGKLEDEETAVYVRLDENGDPLPDQGEGEPGGPPHSQA
jgi:hypothetical protein